MHEELKNSKIASQNSCLPRQKVSSGTMALALIILFLGYLMYDTNKSHQSEQISEYMPLIVKTEQQLFFENYAPILTTLATGFTLLIRAFLPGCGIIKVLAVMIGGWIFYATIILIGSFYYYYGIGKIGTTLTLSFFPILALAIIAFGFKGPKHKKNKG
jgi:hypothetical protein